MEKTEFITEEDIPQIAKTLNKLISTSDLERKGFSKMLLTIYTPVTSGLVFLSTSLNFMGGHGAEKLSFSLILLSGVFIVLASLLEKFGYVRIAITRFNIYTNHVQTTGKHLGLNLNGKGWECFLVELSLYIQIILIVINISSMLWFSLLRIY